MKIIKAVILNIFAIFGATLFLAIGLIVSDMYCGTNLKNNDYAPSIIMIISLLFVLWLGTSYCDEECGEKDN